MMMMMISDVRRRPLWHHCYLEFGCSGHSKFSNLSLKLQYNEHGFNFHWAIIFTWVYCPL